MIHRFTKSDERLGILGNTRSHRQDRSNCLEIRNILGQSLCCHLDGGLYIVDLVHRNDERSREDHVEDIENFLESLVIIDTLKLQIIFGESKAICNNVSISAERTHIEGISTDLFLVGFELLQFVGTYIGKICFNCLGQNRKGGITKPQKSIFSRAHGSCSTHIYYTSFIKDTG